MASDGTEKGKARRTARTLLLFLSCLESRTAEGNQNNIFKEGERERERVKREAATPPYQKQRSDRSGSRMINGSISGNDELQLENNQIRQETRR